MQTHRRRALCVLTLAGLAGLMTALGACTTHSPAPTAESAVNPEAPPPPAAPPAAPPVAPAEPGAAGPQGSGKPCMDIRAALVRCPDGEEITHEGCDGPEYNKRCAPKRTP